MEEMEAWDPHASISLSPFDAAMHQAWEHWLRDHDEPVRMAGYPRSLNPHGSLHWARIAVLQALALSQSPLEECRARFMLARIEHRARDHEAELRQARRLIVLQPRNRDALLVLRRAAKCNGLELLARQAQARLQALPGAPQTDRAPEAEP
jgi:hypothetical protein